MTYVNSFSHLERELVHHYRDQLNHTESEKDIKKFFAQTARQNDNFRENIQKHNIETGP